MMTIATRLVLSATLAVAARSAAAEDSGLRRFEFRERHMGTEFKILLYSPDDALASASARRAFDRVGRLDATLSDYRPDSELMRLCDRAGGPPVPVGDDLFAVLRRSKALSEATDGAFDVTVGPVVKLWRRARRRRELPDPDRLAEAMGRVGSGHMILDERDQTVALRVPGMRLDAGGIAKGLASDAALAALREGGIDRALVAGAGDIVAGDPPPGRDGWLVGIGPLDDPGGPPATFLTLANRAVSTSGDAEQFVEIDGVRYSHIVDPRTGLGLSGRSRVTVVAPRGVTSDSLATAVSVLGPGRGLALIEARDGVEALIVTAIDEADTPRVARSTGFDGLTVRPADPGEVETLGKP